MKFSKMYLMWALFLGMFSCAWAQDEPKPAQEEQFLFGSDNFQVSGFGGPLAQLGSVGSEFAVYSGGGGGALFNRKFFIGGYGMGLATRHLRQDIRNYGDLYIELGHGGLWTGYVFTPNRLLHVSTSVKMGAGALAYSEDELNTGFSQVAEDFIYALNPQVVAEVNVAPWFKFNAGVGFQYLGLVDDRTYTTKSGESRQYFEANDFNKPYLTIGFLFGWFKSKPRNAEL